MDDQKLYIHIERIWLKVLSINIYSIFNDWSPLNYFCHRFAEELIQDGNRAEIRLENEQLVILWKPRDEKDENQAILHSYQIDSETFGLTRAAFNMKSYESIINPANLCCDHYEEQITSQDIERPINTIGFKIFPNPN